jgi:type I restriction enzyme S subunit
LRLRHVAQINPPTPEFDALAEDDQLSFVPLERVWPGRFNPSELRTKSAVSTGYTRFRDGDIVVPKITPTFQADRTLQVAGLCGGVGAGTTELHVVRPGPTIEPRYVRYLFSTRPFLQGGEAEMIGVAGQKRVPDDWLRDLQVPLLDVIHQRRIADFLDNETARIDGLIAAKERMAEVVNALAHDYAEAASLGGASLDLSGPVPTYAGQSRGWKATLLRHLECQVQTGPFGSQLHSEEYVEGGWPVVNPANLRRGVIERIDSMCIDDKKRDELARHKLELHDIVFGRRGEMGRAGLAGAEHVGWLCGTGSLRLRIRDDRIDPHFLKLQLETTAVRSYLLINSVGSTMDNLNSDIVLGVPLVVPNLQIQRRVVEAVMQRRALAGSIAGTLTMQIGLLRERRQALITAAVTGEIEV